MQNYTWLFFSVKKNWLVNSDPCSIFGLLVCRFLTIIYWHWNTPKRAFRLVCFVFNSFFSVFVVIRRMNKKKKKENGLGKWLVINWWCIDKIQVYVSLNQTHAQTCLFYFVMHPINIHSVKWFQFYLVVIFMLFAFFFSWCV